MGYNYLPLPFVDKVNLGIGQLSGAQRLASVFQLDKVVFVSLAYYEVREAIAHH